MGSGPKKGKAILNLLIFFIYLLIYLLLKYKPQYRKHLTWKTSNLFLCPFFRSYKTKNTQSNMLWSLLIILIFFENGFEGNNLLYIVQLKIMHAY